MKKSWIKRGTSQLARTPWKRKPVPTGATVGLRASPLRKKSKAPVPLCKERIQALLRELAIRRDGGCILRHVLGRMPPQYQSCNEVLQAEHLNTRSSSNSYGDMRNIVCLCSHHHLHFKPQHSQLYWELIHELIGEERWAWYLQARDDWKAYHMTLWDWEKIELALKQDLLKTRDNTISEVIY